MEVLSNAQKIAALASELRGDLCIVSNALRQIDAREDTVENIAHMLQDGIDLGAEKRHEHGEDWHKQHEHDEDWHKQHGNGGEWESHHDKGNGWDREHSKHRDEKRERDECKRQHEHKDD